MSKTRQKSILILVALIAIVDIAIYWNIHLYYRAKRETENTRKKTQILMQAKKIYPFNDLVFYELGKLYFNSGVKNIGDIDLRDAYLNDSLKSFARSIRLNPCSLYSHFYLAQTLFYKSHLSPTFDADYYGEYKKAALLTGHNTQVYYEVGNILFSNWPFLSPEEKTFTKSLLRRIPIDRKQVKLKNILQIWAMNVMDYRVMEEILPRNPDAYNLYAQFLGEKSLSLEERHKILNRAEFMEFEQAKNIHSLGKREYQFFRLDKATGHFEHCLKILSKIHLYQNLTEEKIIDVSEFNDIKKSAVLHLAKCLIEQDKNLKKAESLLHSYLEMENRNAAVAELASYLTNRGWFEEKKDSDFRNLNRLSFRLLLDFKQSRYRDIVSVGNRLKQSFVVVPDSEKENYAKILQIVGDSYQKVDYIYDAEESYQKALEIEPDNLQTLLKMRKNYERLNEEEKIREIDEKIDSLLSPQTMTSRDITLMKEKKHSEVFTLSGKRVQLHINFKETTSEPSPLLTLLFNGELVWENYLTDSDLVLSLNSVPGKNRLDIVPVNRSISLNKITFSSQ